MSVPKVKCPSCGTEWAGAVVFCGECGTPITAPTPAAPGDRTARVPPAPQGAPPVKPTIRMSAPTKPLYDAKPVKPAPDAGGARASRPSDAEQRRTLMGAPTLVSPGSLPKAAEPARPAKEKPAPEPVKVAEKPAPEPVKAAEKPAPEPAKPQKRQRKPSLVIANEPATQEEAEKLLEALDAGFDNIVRPTTEVPVLPITPSMVPDVPVEKPAEPAAEGPAAIVEAPAPAAPSLTPSISGVSEGTPAGAEPPAPEITVEIVEATPSEAAAAPVPLEPAPAQPAIDEAARRAQHEADMAEVRALFTEMAIGHARPLRDFMIEVSWGDPGREWLEVASAASSALRRACDALEMTDLGAALDGFTAALELAGGEAAGAIGRDAKDLLLGAYGKLVEMLPAAFALEGERGRREPVIVRALLLQVPGVQKVALDKIYAAGLTSLEMLYAAGPRELAETTGLDVEIAARIHDRFQSYRREVGGLDPTKDRAAERAEIAAALIELGRAHDEHERLARAWTPDAGAARVRARKERNDAFLKISVLLARVGEVDRIKALEKMPFAQKIRELQLYLDEATRKAARP